MVVAVIAEEKNWIYEGALIKEFFQRMEPQCE